MEESVQNTGKTSILLTAFPDGSKTLLFSAAIACYSGSGMQIWDWGRGLFLPDEYFSADEKITSIFWDHNHRLTIHLKKNQLNIVIS